jgi:ParB-like chromosome segregation protein Spo0J
MSTRSAESVSPAPPSLPEPKQRPIPRKVHQAIELIATGRAKTITAAAERVGYARETLSKHLSRPECIEAMKARAAKEVALGSGRAAARLNELMEGPSAKVALEATKYSLGVAGIKPADTAVNVNLGLELKAGYVIDLSGRNRQEGVRKEMTAGVVIEGHAIAGIGPGKVIEGKAIDAKRGE